MAQYPSINVIHHRNKSNKSDVTISEYVEKAFDKGQQPFMLKSESGYRGNVPQHKDPCTVSAKHIRLSSEKMKHFFEDQKQECPHLPLLLLVTVIKEKAIKGI